MKSLTHLSNPELSRRIAQHLEPEPRWLLGQVYSVGGMWQRYAGAPMPRDLTSDPSIALLLMLQLGEGVKVGNAPRLILWQNEGGVTVDVAYMRDEGDPPLTRAVAEYFAASKGLL